jgi:hypothetical protein
MRHTFNGSPVRSFWALALVALLDFASDSQAWGASYSELPDAPQLIYQNGVPHTNRNGLMQLQPDADSFLPRCAYAVLPDMLPGLRDAGFNCFKPWNGVPLGALLPEANRSGMQLVKELLVAPCSYRAHPDCNPDSNADSQIAAFSNDVAAHAKDPSILAWYLEEEIIGCSNPSSNCAERTANYRKLSAALKRVDPVHPNFNLEMGLPGQGALPWWNDLNSTGDIAVIDEYPFAKGNESTIEASVANTSRLVALNRQHKPVWITVQAFEQPSPQGPAWRMPTPRQLRVQVFAALIHGATGIFYFAVDGWEVRNAQVIGIAPSPPAVYANHTPKDVVASAAEIGASETLWGSAVQLNQELSRLQGDLLGSTSRLPYTVSIQGHGLTATPIRTLLKERDGTLTLMAVNIDNAPLNLRVELSRDPLDLRSLDAQGAATRMAANGRNIEDSIEGFGVRIYQFK